MRALILAAGRGSRMGDRTEGQPKCLLEVDGRALVEHQLDTLADCGVGPVALVVGYRAEEIKEVVGIRAEYFDNPRWRNTNSMYSFWIAREWIKSDVLVLNGDLLVHPDIIERLLQAESDAIAIDSGSGKGAEQMKVEVADGRLVGMSKTLPVERTAGENVGILCLREATALRLAEHAGKILEGRENDWLGAAVSEVAKDRPIHVVDIAGLPWGEIDFQADLHRVRRSVWPAIRGAARGRSWPRRVGRALATVSGAAALSLLINALAGARPQTEWDAVRLAGLSEVDLTSKQGRQIWAELSKGDSAELRIHGPVRFRVDSRLVLGEDPAPERYAVEVTLDGVPLKWEDHLTTLSGTWRTTEGGVAKRERIEIEVPEGDHRLQLRLVSPERSKCLVRGAVAVPGPVAED